MTRKDFEMIAGVIRRVGTGDHPEDWTACKGRIALELAETLKSTNPRFNAERFVRACLGEPTRGELFSR